VLTDAGLAKLRDAASTHFAQVEALFGARFDASELAALTELLARLGGEGSGDCEPPG
jgi:hypothetical protein